MGLTRWIVRSFLKSLGIKIEKKPYCNHGPDGERGHAAKWGLKAIATLRAQAFEKEFQENIVFDESRWWWKHPEALRWSKNQAESRQWHKWKYLPEYKLKKTMRCAIWSAVKMDNATKYARTFALIGCPITELKKRIEKQFELGMTWENYGTFWEVDHVRPLSSFDLSKQSEQRKAFHFSNLRPLPKHQNRSKHAARSRRLEKFHANL